MTNGEPPLVAHIIYALDTGGLENGLVNIINRSPAERYRHVIICLTKAENFAQRVSRPDVRVIELHKNPGHDIGLYWRLWRVLREIKPDIIHSRNLAALETQALGFIMPGVKQVHGEHGRDMSDLDGSNWKYQLLRKLMRVRIDAYVTVSKDLERWLVDSVGVNAGKIYQIYNGVDQLLFTPHKVDRNSVFPEGFLPKARASVIFGTVGRLAEVKDQHTLLLAFKSLLHDKPDLRESSRLLIVGGGPLEDKLITQVEALGLSGMVWMTGDRTDIPELLQCMDVFVLPSLAEGVSNTVLEAMASGLPVLATNVGGNPELVEAGVNGMLVPASEVGSMAEAMNSLAESETTRKDMGQRALQRIYSQFSWDKTVSAYLGMYDELLGRNSASATKVTTG